MTRTEILTRYRRLRQISKELHQDVLDIIAPDAELVWAKRLDLARGRTLLTESENEFVLVEDLEIYVARPGRSHPLDRYARAAGLAPGSDRAILHEAMRHARFSLWRVERHHKTEGLILRDLLRDEETWLVDEALAKGARPGMEMAVRLLKPDQFAMTARVVVPLMPELMTRAELMEEVFIRAPALKRLQPGELASDPRFAVGVYREAVAAGVMDFIRFERK